MSQDEKTALVRAPSVAVAELESALVRRGLDDLAGLTLRKARVLLVNDHRTLLEEMEQILTASGYEVCSTHRREDAVNLANAFLEARGLTLEPDGRWMQHGLPASEFEPQFVMLGASMPAKLVEELCGIRVPAAIKIFWGDEQELDNLEQRLGYCPYALATPLRSEEVLDRMKSWVAQEWTDNGSMLDAAERHLEALQCHDRALAIDPGNFFALCYKGFCLEASGRLSEAVQCFEKAAEIDPAAYDPWLRDPGFWNDKAVCLGKMARFEEAILCCEKSLASDPPEVLAWYNKACALEGLGRMLEAARCCEKYLAVAPANADPRCTEHAKALLRDLKSKLEGPG